eukprot:jgi/Bigna1/72274/fgenesh1_pg.19_\
MSVPSREILRWIQSLDLTYSVRNVRRDFANGFLVAEILSRFKEYTNEINMHSFDNGTAISRRKDNWQQLLKIFKKREIPILEDLAHAVLHCQAMAAVQMIEKLYAHLTKRSIAPTETLIEDTPAYAKPTASRIVKDTMKGPVATEENDQLTNTGYAKDALDQHQMQLRQDRMKDRERYTHTSKHRMMAQRMLRVATRQVQHDDFKQPQIQFLKTVNVKPITEGMAQLRGGTQRMANVSNTGSSALRKASTITSDISNTGVKVTIPKVLDPIVHKVLNMEEKQSMTFIEFCDAISSKKPKEVIEVFSALDSALDQCVSIAMEEPKQFWKLSGILCKAYAGAPSKATSFVLDFTTTFARKCGDIDSGETATLFQDYMLPKVIILFKTLPNKREDIVDIMTSFCFSNSDMLALLKILKEDLENAALVQCFALLSNRTAYHSKELQDVYFFYVTFGLRSPSKQLRTHALLILASLCKESPNLSLNMLGELQKLLEDPWWGIQAGIFHVMCASITSIQQEEQKAQLQEIMEGILKKASPMVLRGCIYWMADCLPGKKANASWIIAMFMSQMKLVSEDIQKYLCGTGQPDSAVAGLGSFPVQRALGIANAVVADLLENKNKNLDEVHVQLLSASILKVRKFEESSKNDWSSVLQGLIRYVLVEFLDVQRCQWASSVLERFFLDETTCDIACAALLRKTEGSQKAPKFFGFLKMVFPESPSECKEAVQGFLMKLIENKEQLYKDIYNLIKNFESAEPDRYNSSNLKILMERLKTKV